MRQIVVNASIFLLGIFLVITGLGQDETSSKGESEDTATQESTIPSCPENSDRLYDRQEILKQLAGILNSSVPEYIERFENRFSAEDGRGNLFFVYDLTDPANKSSLTNVCIDFRNDHIYHFAPIEYDFSFSHILILEYGKLKVFKSINCADRGDKLEDVLDYIERKLRNDKDRNEIIERVRSYRKYGWYYKPDIWQHWCGEPNENDK